MSVEAVVSCQRLRRIRLAAIVVSESLAASPCGTADKDEPVSALSESMVKCDDSSNDRVTENCRTSDTVKPRSA